MVLSLFLVINNNTAQAFNKGPAIPDDMIILYKMQPIHIAAFAKNPVHIMSVISQGADVNALDAVGRTPLMLAAATDNLPIAKVLLDSGANPLIADIEWMVPLHWAAKKDDVDMARVLVGAGGNINHYNLYGVTSGHLAISSKSKNVLYYFLQNGMDVSLNTAEGKNVLLLAYETGDETILAIIQNFLDDSLEGITHD